MFLAAEIAAALGVGKETAVSVLFCVDTCSGAPLGLNLGIGAADAERARLLMLHAISPKPAIVLANGTFVPWAHGVPRLVKGDNGSIFRTDEFVLPLTDLNIMVRHTPPYSPLAERGDRELQSPRQVVGEEIPARQIDPRGAAAPARADDRQAFAA